MTAPEEKCARCDNPAVSRFLFDGCARGGTPLCEVHRDEARQDLVAKEIRMQAANEAARKARAGGLI